MSASPKYLYLTTTGRLSGRPRRIEIWFTRHAGRYYLMAEHGRRARWVQNLLADPAEMRATLAPPDAFEGTAEELAKLSAKPGAMAAALSPSWKRQPTRSPAPLPWPSAPTC